MDLRRPARLERITVGSLTLYSAADGSWTVAENNCWLPGVYDSQETAAAAAELSNEQLADLAPICHIDGQDRPITAADIAALQIHPGCSETFAVQSATIES